jgi:hypothetical protein
MEVGMIAVIGFLSSTVGRVLVGAGGLLALWISFAWHYEGKGEAKAVAKMEKATTHATNQGKRAADRSLSGRVRGTTDPGYRD